MGAVEPGVRVGPLELDARAAQRLVEVRADARRRRPVGEAPAHDPRGPPQAQAAAEDQPDLALREVDAGEPEIRHVGGDGVAVAAREEHRALPEQHQPPRVIGLDVTHQRRAAPADLVEE